VQPSLACHFSSPAAPGLFLATLGSLLLPDFADRRHAQRPARSSVASFVLFGAAWSGFWCWWRTWRRRIAFLAVSTCLGHRFAALGVLAMNMSPTSWRCAGSAFSSAGRVALAPRRLHGIRRPATSFHGDFCFCRHRRRLYLAAVALSVARFLQWLFARPGPGARLGGRIARLRIVALVWRSPIDPPVPHDPPAERISRLVLMSAGTGTGKSTVSEPWSQPPEIERIVTAQPVPPGAGEGRRGLFLPEQSGIQ